MYDLEITLIDDGTLDTVVAVRDPVTGLTWVSRYNTHELYEAEAEDDVEEYIRSFEDDNRFLNLDAASADDLDFDTIAGAYWYFADHHGGQGSDEYAWLSALGDIYSPGPLETSDRISDTAKEHYNYLREVNKK